jgi:hypothetical protein
MESSGCPEKVHISASTYQLMAEEPGFVFEPRGVLSVKGKGNMETYFVSRVAEANGHLQDDR